MDHNEIYRAALKTYGADTQILMVMEEMSELQKKLCKNRRGKNNLGAIAEEIADVEIMLEQMKLLFDCEADVRVFKNVKAGRLAERILGKCDDGRGNKGI